jgi:hypothetical protein
MKVPSLILLILLTSCKENSNVSKTTNAQLGTENKEPIKLTYYKCDYSKKRFDTLFSSGSERDIHEVWGVSPNDIITFPIINSSSVDSNAMVKSAGQHLKQRFTDMDLEISNFQIQWINHRDTSNPRNRFAEITFLYDKRGYYQKVPVLLDGRIILSNCE